MTLEEILNKGSGPGYSITDFGDRLVAVFRNEESAKALAFLFGYQWVWTNSLACWCYKENYSFCAFAGYSEFDSK
jgi:hypothetical protein